MTLKAVFFDLDGTLLDTAHDLSAALNTILIEDKRPPLDLKETREIVSEGALALVMRGYQLSGGDARAPALRQRLLDRYAENLATHTVKFDGIDALIAQLTEHQIAWGIVTNKPLPYAKPLMTHFSFASAPSCLLCPEHVKHRKPAPESLFLACEQTNCHVTEAIYIGDHRRDIECGKNAGMPTIAVSYGYLPSGQDIQQWNADHCVDSVAEIWPIISKYQKG